MKRRQTLLFLSIAAFLPLRALPASQQSQVLAFLNSL